MSKPWAIVKQHDKEIFDLIEDELERQVNGIELIASENFASEAIIACVGSVLTNKYAEGRPGKRYYGGCEVVDKVEELAIERACAVFGASFANVQAHSGAQANAAAFLALIEPGDKILGMDLSHGGHLTHGSKVNFSGQLYESHFYGLDPETSRLNMDSIRQKALEIKPKLIIAGASAYSRTIDFSSFRSIADEVGAYLLVDMAHISGLVAAGLHPSPIPHAHVVTSTTHKTLRGPRGGVILWNDESLSAKFNKAVFPGTQGGPLEHVIAAKAICFKEAQSQEFREYQSQVLANTRAMAEIFNSRNVDMVSSGSDNHLLLLDLTNKGVSGKDLEEALGRVGITLNKNTVPNERRSPFVTSGIRVGTPAVTTRGMKESQMHEIANLICDTLEGINKEAALGEVRQKVTTLAKQFPIYSEWTTK